MKGMQYDNWFCVSMVYYVGSSLPPIFRDLEYAFLEEKYVGLAEEHYPDINRLMYKFDNHSANLPSTLAALMNSPDDQIVPRAPLIVKWFIISAQNLFVGTPNSTHRSSSCGSRIRTSSHQAFGSRNDIVALALTDQPHSYSSPPTLALSPRGATLARRLTGNVHYISGWHGNDDDVNSRSVFFIEDTTKFE